MQRTFPMDRVPNLQSFPESGYPVAAYYGVDSTLNDIQGGSASKGDKATAAMSPGERNRMVLTILTIIFIGYSLFHWYNK